MVRKNITTNESDIIYTWKSVKFQGKGVQCMRYKYMQVCEVALQYPSDQNS